MTDAGKGVGDIPTAATPTQDLAVGRRFVALGVGETFARFLTFGAAVYMARRLGADRYGMIVLAMTVLAYVGRLADCGIDLLGVHDVARRRDRLSDLVKSYVGTRLLAAIVLSALVVGAGLFVFPQPDGAVIAAYAFTLLPIALGTRWVHLGLERTVRVSVSRAATDATTALVIILLVHSPDDVWFPPLAQLLGEGVGAFLLLRWLPTGIGSHFSIGTPADVSTLYRRAWPLVATALLGLVIFNSDMFFLRAFSGLSTVGYYAAAYALVSFFLNLGKSYQVTLMPTVSRALGNPARKQVIYHNAAAQVFAGVFPVAVGGWLMAGDLIPAVFGVAYTPAVAPLEILIWVLPIALLRNVAQAVMIAHEQQRSLLGTSAVAAAANVALNVALIPIWGMRAAALVTVVTEAVRTVPMVWLVARSGLPPTPLRRYWRTLLAAGAMVPVVLLIRGHNPWAAIAAGALTYAIALYLVGGIRLNRGALPDLTV